MRPSCLIGDCGRGGIAQLRPGRSPRPTRAGQQVTEPSQRVPTRVAQPRGRRVAEQVLVRHQPDRARPGPSMPDPAGAGAAAAVNTRAVHGQQESPAVGQSGEFTARQREVCGEVGVVLGDLFQRGQPVQYRLPQRFVDVGGVGIGAAGAGHRAGQLETAMGQLVLAAAPARARSRSRICWTESTADSPGGATTTTSSRRTRTVIARYRPNGSLHSTSHWELPTSVYRN